MERSAGILLPILSLPSRYGIGCFSQEAFDFVDWLRGAGQSYWQILPLFPTSFGDSPYQSFSAFAGNPYFISLETLVEEGVLTNEECSSADLGESGNRVNYEKQYNARYPLLRLAYQRSGIWKDPDYQQFVSENNWWLADYALFMAVKQRFDGAPWTRWAEDIRMRWGFALDYYRRELYYDIEFHQYLQFKFFQQWHRLKAYANQNGIRIIGDIPIYAAMDSADVWAHPELFQLDGDGHPTAVAGCPPDGFAAGGQLWGNPLYRWEYHRDTGYAWWISRLRHCFQNYDVTRIDHFRGFDEYYSIPASQINAVNGSWKKGPGIELFRRAEQALGPHDVIAEDLGYLTDSVRQLVHDSGFPGMKVLEFAFDSRSSDSTEEYLPHNYPENCIAYTGTHDNETLAGWLEGIDSEALLAVREYLCDRYTPVPKLHDPLVALVMRSPARLCVIPMQDHLGLDNHSRINTPSTVGTNWLWRLDRHSLTPALQQQIRRVTTLYGRERKGQPV